MEKYLNAIRKGQERLEVLKEAKIKAYSMIGAEYDYDQAREMYYKATDYMQGIRLVAMVDASIGIEEWKEIVKACEEITGKWYDEYNGMLESMIKELSHEE